MGWLWQASLEKTEIANPNPTVRNEGTTYRSLGTNANF